MSLKITLFFALFFNFLIWQLIVPIWHFPDEQAHFGQAAFFAENGRFQNYKELSTNLEIVKSEEILGTIRDWRGNNKFTYNPNYKIDYSSSLTGKKEEEIESYNTGYLRKINAIDESTRYPPLYYFLASSVYKMFGGSDLFVRIYAVRLLSLIFFCTTFVTIFALSKLIFPSKFFYQVSLTTVVSFMPMYIFSQGGVTSDSLYNLLFTLGIYQMARINFVKFSWPDVLLFILIFIAGIATKFQFLLILLLPILTITYLLLIYPLKKKIVLFSLGIFSIFLATVVYNYFYFFINGHGKPQLNQILSMPIIPDTASLNNLYFPGSGFFAHLFFTLKHTYGEVLPWYFGVYKWLSLSMPDFVYEIINRLLLFGVFGLAAYIVYSLKNWKLDRQFKIVCFFSCAAILYFLALTLFDWLFVLRNGYSFGIQGRYFFPLIVAHLSLLLIGLFFLVPKFFKKWLSLSLVFSIFVFNYFSLYWVAAHYYDLFSISSFVNQLSQYKPEILKGYGGLLLIFLSFASTGFFFFEYVRLTLNKHVDD